MENLHQTRRLVIDLRRAKEAEAVVTDSSRATASPRAFRRHPVNGVTGSSSSPAVPSPGADPIALRLPDALRASGSLASYGRSRRRARPREREVAALLVEGLTNGELATRLFISPKTASVHVSNILAKLSMTSRAEIAVYAVCSWLASA